MLYVGNEFATLYVRSQPNHRISARLFRVPGNKPATGIFTTHAATPPKKARIKLLEPGKHQ